MKAFFQPSGDVVVVGTTGNVSLRSWRVRQLIGLGMKGGFEWSLGYQYRSDRSEFHPGLKTTTHTQPPSIDAFTIYTRETTISRNYGVDLRVARQWNLPRWRIGLSVNASPATNARLTTLLPDKYPGQTIVFNAIAAKLNPTFDVTYGRKWPRKFSVGYSRTFSHLRSRQFVRHAATIGLELALSQH